MSLSGCGDAGEVGQSGLSVAEVIPALDDVQAVPTASPSSICVDDKLERLGRLAILPNQPAKISLVRLDLEGVTILIRNKIYLDSFRVVGQRPSHHQEHLLDQVLAFASR